MDYVVVTKIEKCFYNFRVEPEFSVPLLFLGSYANMHVYEKNVLIQEREFNQNM